MDATDDPRSTETVGANSRRRAGTMAGFDARVQEQLVGLEVRAAGGTLRTSPRGHTRTRQRRHLAGQARADARRARCRQSRKKLQAPRGEVAVRVDLPRGRRRSASGIISAGRLRRFEQRSAHARRGHRAPARAQLQGRCRVRRRGPRRRARTLSGREGAGSFASRKTLDIRGVRSRRAPRRVRRAPPRPPSGAVKRDSSPMTGTDDHGPPSASTRTTSSRTRRHASPCASRSGTAGLRARARRRDEARRRARCARARALVPRARRATDARARAAASAQPAPGSRSRTAGAPTGGARRSPTLRHRRRGPPPDSLARTGRFGSGRFAAPRRRRAPARLRHTATCRYRRRRAPNSRARLTSVVAFLLLALPGRPSRTRTCHGAGTPRS